MINLICEQCKKIYKAKPYMEKKSIHHFCGFTCYGNWQKINKKGIGSTKVIIECKFCGKKVEKHPCKIKDGKGGFCSHHCFIQWRVETGDIAGENSASWLGGHTQYRGKNWSSQRKQALKRDNFVCQNCGSQNSLVVHHLHPYHLFSNYKEANQLENLITLCKSCHGKIEIEFNRNHKDYCQGRRIPHLIPDIKKCKKCGIFFLPSFHKTIWCPTCETVVCKNCNKKFINKKHREKSKFCSKKCWYEFQDKNAIWKRHCLVCNKKIKSGKNYCKHCFLTHIKPASKRRLVT